MRMGDVMAGARVGWSPRIVGGWRVGFVVACFALVMVYDFMFDNPLSGPSIDPVFAQLFSFIGVVGFWVCCARMFRGPQEELVPPRPWWKMTYGSPASWLLATAVGAGLIYSIVRICLGTVFSDLYSPALNVLQGVELIFNASLCALLVNSAIRIQRAAR